MYLAILPICNFCSSIYSCREPIIMQGYTGSNVVNLKVQQQQGAENTNIKSQKQQNSKPQYAIMPVTNNIMTKKVKMAKYEEKSGIQIPLNLCAAYLYNK